MSRRSGLTLVEVLVAIFVMGIGMMSLLVLFPLGALNMANAIKDDQTGHASYNANSFASQAVFNLRYDPAILPPGQPGYYRNGSGPPLPAFLPNYPGPGYPVYVDPLGVLGGAPLTLADYFTTSGIGGVPRLAPDYVTNPARAPQGAALAAQQYFTLLDNISFYGNGVPGSDNFGRPSTPASDGEVVRPAQSSYSWAYLLRPPAMPAVAGGLQPPTNPSTVDLWVVVYKQRSTAVLGETAYSPIHFDPGSQMVSIPYTGVTPNIRRGGWVMDATMYYVDDTGTTQPYPCGFFYRVANVSENTAGVLDVELESAPQVATFRTNTAGANVDFGVLIVLDDVVEVFHKGT